jgi:hypothetical protein
MLFTANILTLLLVAASPDAAAIEKQPRFSDFALSGSVIAGSGHETILGPMFQVGATISFFAPLIDSFGLRVSASAFNFTSFRDADKGGILTSIGGGAAYTFAVGEGLVSLSDPWGIGIAAGAEYVPWGFVVPHDSPITVDLDGALVYQEISIRSSARDGILELGLRSDQLVGASFTASGSLYFRFSFRL